jgi:hypothetical protein
MRDVISAASGRSGFIGRYRMIEHLDYFMLADPAWAKEHLVTPLGANDTQALAFWHPVARGTRSSAVLRIIGSQMAERATDPRLGRTTRADLVFSLVVECLHSFREGRAPAVPESRIQQTIRSLDDEVRAHAAEAVLRFLHDVSAPHALGSNTPSAEDLFQTAAKPFLQRVWPQERSLTTPGVSRAFAGLPVATRGAFVDAVNAIERFLIPFECWSMGEYGWFGEDGKAWLSIIDNPDKATALLRLLDLTIGRTEGTIVPDDIGDALEQVRRVLPNAGENTIFRRLAAAARRR